MRKLFKDFVSLLSDTSSILADESIDNTGPQTTDWTD